jgi:predicted ATP-grasp superfamily ATP-dependent carboligase
MNLIIIGASARAAAFSAHRAGLHPWCVDLFADADLACRFPVRRLPLAGYPQAFLDALCNAPEAPLLYTGGLENYPDLLACIERPIWGNPPDVLRRVRDPFLLATTLRRHGLPTAEVRREPPVPGDRRRWLVKPLRGSGGVGIQGYRGQPFDPASHYLQEYVDGDVYGAVLFGVPGRPAIYLAATRSLHEPWLHAPRFHYAGGIVAQGPASGLLQKLGAVVAQEFSLRGLFGIDAVLRQDSGRWSATLLEANPRYTASVELLERQWGRSALALQWALFEGGEITWPSASPRYAPRHGKAILYARRTLRFPERGPWQAAVDARSDMVEYADIPHAGDVIRRGRPVLTVFADHAACADELRCRVEALDRPLYG